MPYTNAWDETQPPDTQYAKLLGQDLRSLKTDIRERLSLLSGHLSDRPTPEASFTASPTGGLLFFATDTGQAFNWNGSAWIEVTRNLLDRLVDSQGFSQTFTMDGSAHAIYLTNVPLLGATHALKIRGQIELVSTAINCQFGFDINNNAVHTLVFPQNPSPVFFSFEYDIQNLGNQFQQILVGTFTDITTGVTYRTISGQSYNTAQSFSVAMLFSSSPSANGRVTGNGWRVEYIS